MRLFDDPAIVTLALSQGLRSRETEEQVREYFSPAVTLALSQGLRSRP